MRKTSRLFCASTKKFQHPLLYFVKENYIVLPVRSTDDFCESTIQKKAFVLGTKEQQTQSIDLDPSWRMRENESILIDEIHRKEKMHPKYLALSPDLAKLAMYYLIHNRLNEAQATMQRAVELEKQLPGCTGCLPGWTNLAIIRYLDNGDKNYCNHVFEFCVEGWYRSRGELSIRALPYFYNFLVTGNHDTEFFEKARHDFLNLILPTLALNNKHPFYTICNELRERLQQPALCQRVPTSMQYRA